jgi:hypothetical protein
LTVPPFNNTTPTATFPLSVQFHKIVLQINRPNYHDKKKKKKAGRSSSFKLFLHDGMEQWTRVGAYNPRYMSLDRGARSQQKKSNHSKPDTNKRYNAAADHRRRPTGRNGTNALHHHSSPIVA